MNKTIRITIADDHQIFADGLSEILNGSQGISVTATAKNGVELLEILKTTPTDLILMDVNMPEMNGIEATEQVKLLYPEIKILMLTMYDTSDYIQKVLKAGAHGYVLKNTSKTELVEAIETVFGGQSYFSSAVTHTIMQSLRGQEKPSTQAINIEVTDREIDVLKLIAQELTTHEIGAKLFISHHTVETHRKNLISKLGVRNVAGLVKYAVQHGYVD